MYVKHHKTNIVFFIQRNGRYPDRIIIFRDGVGDGQLDIVSNYEVKQFIETFNYIEPGYAPRLSMIVVQKRINARIFASHVSTLLSF